MMQDIFLGLFYYETNLKASHKTKGHNHPKMKNWIKICIYLKDLERPCPMTIALSDGSGRNSLVNCESNFLWKGPTISLFLKQH